MLFLFVECSRANRLRIIAKQRRDTENSILTELIDLLPLDKKVLAKKDKSSLLRLVLSYMRFRAAFDAGEFRITHHLWSVCLRSIFVFCLAPNMVGYSIIVRLKILQRISITPKLSDKCCKVFQLPRSLYADSFRYCSFFTQLKLSIYLSIYCSFPAR